MNSSANPSAHEMITSVASLDQKKRKHDLRALPANVLFRLCEYLSASNSATLCVVCKELNKEISALPIWKSWCVKPSRINPFLGTLPPTVLRNFRDDLKTLYSCIAYLRAPFICRNVLTESTAYHQTSRDDQGQDMKNVCRKSDPRSSMGSFWSSTGNFGNDELFPQSLTFLFGLGRVPHLLHEVRVKPYCARYQRGWPFYGGRNLVVEIGFSPTEFHTRFEFEWERTTDFSVFEFPHAVVGSSLRVTFLQPYQRQEEEDNILYFAIDRVMAFGTPIAILGQMAGINSLFSDVERYLNEHAEAIGFNPSVCYPHASTIVGDQAPNEPHPANAGDPLLIDNVWMNSVRLQEEWLDFLSVITQESRHAFHRRSSMKLIVSIQTIAATFGFSQEIDSDFTIMVRTALMRRFQSRNDWDGVHSWLEFMIRAGHRLNHEETLMLAKYPEFISSRVISYTASAEMAEMLMEYNNLVELALNVYMDSGMVQKALQICMEKGHLERYVKYINQSKAFVNHAEVIQEVTQKYGRKCALAYVKNTFNCRATFHYHPITPQLVNGAFDLDLLPHADLREVYYRINAEIQRPVVETSETNESVEELVTS